MACESPIKAFMPEREQLILLNNCNFSLSQKQFLLFSAVQMQLQMQCFRFYSLMGNN